jgi:hypothetical protein
MPLRLATFALCCLALSSRAEAFCGFFVGKADAQLFNKSSQVAIVRDGSHTVITMGNDYSGPLTEFALVVPVPSVLQKEQIHIGDKKVLDRLGAYSAPRLVEYTDPDPCTIPRAELLGRASGPWPMRMKKAAPMAALGVKVEAEYTVGEYDIVLLSAKESGGLEIWLRESGYRIPKRAAEALAPYVKQRMKFFVARVNLKEAHGVQELRPIQIAFDSERFMLPIRLGMANSEGGAQDLIVYAMTRKGRVESTNYQTVKMAGDVDVPEFVQQDFGGFYKAAFARAVAQHDRRAILTEYVWDMGFCDPCAAPPLEQAELASLGVYWLDAAGYHGGGMPLTLTRLHVRYDGEHFPEDLMFQATGDQQPFQARYVLRHPFRGEVSCEAGQRYLDSLHARRAEEAATLASLTGWSAESIARKMGPEAPRPPRPPWWKKLWQ